MADVNISNILLLVHGDSITDSSTYHRTITNSSVSTTSSQKHFSSHNSLDFTGGKKSFYVSNLISGTMDYTIDFWYYQSGGGNGVLFSHGGSNNTSGGVYSIGNNFANWYAGDYRIQSTFTNSTWKHFACVRKSGTTKFYINGNQVGSTTYNPSFSNSNERFGWNDSLSSEYFDGYVQELRVCNVAAWDGNFTPPTEPYLEYSISSTVAPSGSGVVNGLGKYGYGSNATITAVPNSNYLFKDWLLKGYTQLDYIESAGTQYINSGVVPNINTKYEVCYQRNQSGNYTIFGGGNNYNDNYIALYHDAGRNCVALRFGTSGTEQDLYPLSMSAKINSSISGTKFIVDGTEQDIVDYTAINTAYPIYIFCFNRAGVTGEFSSIRLYYLKFYDGSNLIRDFIPVIRHSDGAIGLLDLVNLKFYGNSGTGTFTAGPTKEVA